MMRDRVLEDAEKEHLRQIAPIDMATIRAAFDAQPDAFDELRLSHILVRVGGQTRTQAQALARIQLIRTELKNRASFESLARKYYDDVDSRNEGGQLPPIHREDLKPSIAPTVRSLHPGQVSQPVLTDDGYHLIRLDERTTATFDSNKALLEFNLRDAWANQQIEAYKKTGDVHFDATLWDAQFPLALGQH